MDRETLERKTQDAGEALARRPEIKIRELRLRRQRSLTESKMRENKTLLGNAFDGIYEHNNTNTSPHIVLSYDAEEAGGRRGMVTARITRIVDQTVTSPDVVNDYQIEFRFTPLDSGGGGDFQIINTEDTRWETHDQHMPTTQMSLPWDVMGVSSSIGPNTGKDGLDRYVSGLDTYETYLQEQDDRASDVFKSVQILWEAITDVVRNPQLSDQLPLQAWS